MDNNAGIDTSLFEVADDEIAVARCDVAFAEWEERILEPESTARLAGFVTSRMGSRGDAEFVSETQGGSNLALRFRFRDAAEPDVVLRVPKPGFNAAAFVDEKVTNEVHWMQYLAQHTDIPLPTIHAWGVAADGPEGLGPFILMDFAPGETLFDFLGQTGRSAGQGPVTQEELRLIYDQVAPIYVQLSRLSFSRIGSLSQHEVSSKWSITARPLTLDMHHNAVGVARFPTDIFPTAPLDRARQFFSFASDQHDALLRVHRNINPSPAVAQCRFQSSARLRKLASRFCNESEDGGPFLPVCDGLDARSMLYDAHTGRITAVISLGFTNALPAQLARDPPSWLTLARPELYLNRGLLSAFRRDYEARLEIFLDSLQRVEAQAASAVVASAPAPAPGVLLSSMMRESWNSGRFWFNLAARNSRVADAVYWAVLSEHDDELDITPDVEARTVDYIEHSRRQLQQYRDDLNTFLRTEYADFDAAGRLDAGIAAGADADGLL